MIIRRYSIVFVFLTCLFLAATFCGAADGPTRTGKLTGPFRNTAGHGWYAPLPELERQGDRLGEPPRSSLTLYEDGKLLGKAHSFHRNIERLGEGRYSHWGRGIWFSASDNTDPNTNGRTYSYSIGPSPADFPSVTFLRLLFFPLLAGCLLGPFILAWFYRGTGAAGWMVGTGLSALGLAVFLKANLLPPCSWYAVLIHGSLLVALILAVLVIAFLRHRFGKERQGPRFRTGLAAAWGLAAAVLLGLELFFRLIPVYDTSALNPGVKFNWPDWVNYSRNEYGYRDKRPLNPRPGNVFRVLIVGDSFVEGVGLTREECFGRVMEREANRILEESGRKARVEVLSWGVSGHNTEENVAVIRSQAPEIHPDLILLEYTLSNDSETHPVTLKYRDTPMWVGRIHSFFLEKVRSYTYYWFFKHFAFCKIDYGSPFNRFVARYKDGFPGWEKTKTALGSLAGWLGKTGTEGLVLIFPMMREVPDYPAHYAGLHRKLGLVLKRYSIEYLDLTDFFSRTGVPGTGLVISKGDDHPNALANRLLGEHLAKALLNRPGFIEWEAGRR